MKFLRRKLIDFLVRLLYRESHLMIRPVVTAELNLIKATNE